MSASLIARRAASSSFSLASASRDLAASLARCSANSATALEAQKHRLWDEDGDGVATTARERAHKAMAKKKLLDGVVRVATRPFEVGGTGKHGKLAY